MEAIGYLAGLISLVGYLPQTIKTIRTEHTKDLSLQTFVLLSLSTALWVAYGIGEHKNAIWIPNAVVLISSLIIVTMKLRHG